MSKIDFMPDIVGENGESEALAAKQKPSLTHFGPGRAGASLSREQISPSPGESGGPEGSNDQPRPRRRRRRITGRIHQINIKTTASAIEHLYRIADERDLPLGAVLEMALQALDYFGRGTFMVSGANNNLSRDSHEDIAQHTTNNTL